MHAEGRTLVLIATYNEIENLPQLVDEVFRHAPQVDILVVDDDSPDGTGRWADHKAAEDKRLRCLHREGKRGLGSATIAGMRCAIDKGYDLVLTMDADFSHPPRYLPDLLSGVQPHDAAAVDVMIGSRYVAGGGIEGWSARRRWMSRAVNWYARCLLGLGVKDCSGAFRCYRTAMLRRLDFSRLRSRGYAYLEEILFRLKQQGAHFGETPIVFVDRQRGQTKINMREALAALWIILTLALRRPFG